MMTNDTAERSLPKTGYPLGRMKPPTRVRLGLMACLLFSFLLSPRMVSAEAIVGKQAPALITKELDGSNFDLNKLGGKTVLIHYWATWCPSCREEMGVLDQFYREHQNQGLIVLALSTDKPKHRNEVIELMKPLSFPAAMLDDTVENGFGSPRALPITYVVGPDGTVVARLTPDTETLSEKILSETVGPLLRK